MTTEQATHPPAEETFDVIGTRPIRHDGPDKVTGRARYAADIHPPGWLVGKVLRSPHAHAVIRGIDATRALAITGRESRRNLRRLPRGVGRDRRPGRGGNRSITVSTAAT